MTVSTAFLEEIQDSLRPLGQVSVRRMFGGAGIFCDGLMFALVIDETVYLNPDAGRRDAFVRERLDPFSYRTRAGKTVETSYCRAPERLLDDADDLRDWAARAIAVARRKAAAATSTTAAQRQGKVRTSRDEGAVARGRRKGQ